MCDLIPGEVEGRLECSWRAKTFEPISVSLCSAATSFPSNSVAPQRQRPDSPPEWECEVYNFLATETSPCSHQGVSLISSSLRYFLTAGLFVLLPICQSWLSVLWLCCLSENVYGSVVYKTYSFYGAHGYTLNNTLSTWHQYKQILTYHRKSQAIYHFLLLCPAFTFQTVKTGTVGLWREKIRLIKGIFKPFYVFSLFCSHLIETGGLNTVLTIL